jgi:hypothetical protein
MFLYCDPICVQVIKVADRIEFLMWHLTQILVFTVTNQLTPWSSVILRKLTGLHLFKKYSAIYGSRKFISLFTRVRQLTVFYVEESRNIGTYYIIEDPLCQKRYSNFICAWVKVFSVTLRIYSKQEDRV